MLKKHKLALLCGGAAIALSCQVAVAQEADDASAEETLMQDVVVVSGVRKSLAEAIDIKRNSKEFVDALVAEDFAEFPDSNLGEALQRLPGITVDRNGSGSRSNAVGEGSTINVRGLGPEFTRTEINGFTAANSGQGRGFSFNVLTADLFAGADARKSLSAADNEGGLAGTINLRTYQPLDYDERILNVSAKANYGDLAEELNPAGSVIYVDQFNNGRIGIAAGIAFDQSDPQEIAGDVSNWEFLRDSLRGNFDLLSPTEQAAVQDVVIPRDPRILANIREQDRLSATLVLEAEVSDELRVTFSNLYGSVDHSGRQIRNDYPIEGFPATFVPVDLVTNGDVFVSGTFPASSHFARIIDYEYGVDSTVYQGILSAEWEPSESFAATAALGYSYGEEDFHTWNSFDIRSAPTDIFYEVIGDFATFTPAVGDPQVASTYSVLSRIRNRPDYDEDQEFSARLDFEWRPDLSFIDSFEFGARYADRDKSFRRFDGRATLDGSITDLTPFLTNFDFDIDGAPANYPTSIIGLRDFDALQNAADPDGFAIPEVMTARYDVTEQSVAGYAMANFDIAEKFSGNAGIRVVKTDQTSAGFQVIGGVEAPAEFENDYSFVLPSFNGKWDFSDDLVGRVAVYRSLTRPQLTDIQPAQSTDDFNGGNGTSGNPELDPFTAWNYEVGLEYYFGDGALLSASVFHKDLNGLIERFVEELPVTNFTTGETFLINLSRPVNGEDASVTGLELGFQTPFWFLSDGWDNLGVATNASFAESEATFRNEADIRSSTLPGLSEATYNLIGYYDDGTYSARLAYNWRSDHLLTVSGSGGNPVSRDDYGQLDFSSSWDVNDQLSFTFDVINLTDEQIRSFSFQREELAQGTLQLGRRFTVGANYKF
jgi:TonB-dependent receptor